MTIYSWRVIRRFLSNFINCMWVIRNPLQTYGYLRSGRAPEIGHFKVGKLRFSGRKEDWVAIREVLIDDEYACVKDLFNSTERPRILDIGSNIGSFAIRVFQHCPDASIASVEAASDTFQMLESNQFDNKSLDWKVFNYGVWKDDGPLTLMRRGISVGHRVIQSGDGDVVQGITLANLLKMLGWDSIDLIKMDIEGGEEAVIPNAEEVLRKTRFLIIEIHNDRIDATHVMEKLSAIYSNQIQLNDRTSSKPLYIMSNEPLVMPNSSRE